MVTYCLAEKTAYAPVAQLDRVSDYESEGREFESLPARHRKQVPIRVPVFYYTAPAQRKRLEGECAKRGARSRSERGQKRSGGAFLTRAKKNPFSKKVDATNEVGAILPTPARQRKNPVTMWQDFLLSFVMHTFQDCPNQYRPLLQTRSSLLLQCFSLRQRLL